jgi:2-polyprenyl-3-methyl-5-hydroxy-6-metoxy-1,4-benzoquinol methylase
MYDEWTKKRIYAIRGWFEKDWFSRKNVLEMGACHGDVGIELMKLGANVTFSDVRMEHMQEIPSKIGFEPNMICINNNEDYTLNKKYDLILHMSLLCHITNWKQDLKRVVNSAEYVILETIVNPEIDAIDLVLPSDNHHYADNNTGRAYITEQSIKNHLMNLGCAVVELHPENTDYNWIDRWTMVRHLYNWNYDEVGSIQVTDSNGINLMTHYRRMYLITKVKK